MESISSLGAGASWASPLRGRNLQRQPLGLEGRQATPSTASPGAPPQMSLEELHIWAPSHSCRHPPSPRDCPKPRPALALTPWSRWGIQIPGKRSGWLEIHMGNCGRENTFFLLSGCPDPERIRW